MSTCTDKDGALNLRRRAAGVAIWRYGGLGAYCRCSDVEVRRHEGELRCGGMKASCDAEV